MVKGRASVPARTLDQIATADHARDRPGANRKAAIQPRFFATAILNDYQTTSGLSENAVVRNRLVDYRKRQRRGDSPVNEWARCLRGVVGDLAIFNNVGRSQVRSDLRSEFSSASRLLRCQVFLRHRRDTGRTRLHPYSRFLHVRERTRDFDCGRPDLQLRRDALLCVPSGQPPSRGWADPC